MPRDEFRLSQVLRLKRREEEQKQLELAALAGEERRLRGRLTSLRERGHAQQRAVTDLRRGGAIDPRELRSALAYLESLQAEVDSHAELVTSVEVRVLQSRDQLIAILKEKQSLETLRRKHEASVEREEALRESRAVDELNSQRFLRRARGA